ncbi:hypothetical protein Zmor_001951 [Zophobas morio]|uniref:Uncharacterized protein n=1 Tax=Zophobas morio TaxID=2755281 RepID=A0AA38IZN4_9CUCU|nr:hypothetical protein Zmor_001951 [Zophobas morio]
MNQKLLQNGTNLRGFAVKKRYCRFGNESGVIRASLTRSNYSVEQKQLIRPRVVLQGTRCVHELCGCNCNRCEAGRLLGDTPHSDIHYLG